MKNINNLPTYAAEYAYVVATESDNEYWFYGAYSERAKAEAAAYDCDGKVFNSLEM